MSKSAPTGPTLIVQAVGSARATTTASGVGRAILTGPASLPAAILLTSTVELLGAVPEGNLIELIQPAWDAILDALRDDPAARFQLPWRKFEELIAASYKVAGFDEVILTPRSGDGGRDVIAVKQGYARIRIIDQVKALGAGRLVDANDVRALLGVLGSDRNASKGFVTTTADFAPGIVQDPSIQPYVPYRLELINGVQLLDRFAKLRSSNNLANQPTGPLR